MIGCRMARIGVLVAATGALAAVPARAALSPSPSRIWIPDRVANAVAYADGRIYLGGTFTYIGPPTGSFVSLDATTGASQPGAVVVGFVATSLADGAGGWYLGGAFTHA